jgi:L-amino acid N-acyltransferase YncA
VSNHIATGYRHCRCRPLNYSVKCTQMCAWGEKFNNTDLKIIVLKQNHMDEIWYASYSDFHNIQSFRSI